MYPSNEQERNRSSEFFLDNPYLSLDVSGLFQITINRIDIDILRYSAYNKMRSHNNASAFCLQWKRAAIAKGVANDPQGLHEEVTKWTNGRVCGMYISEKA